MLSAALNPRRPSGIKQVERRWRTNITASLDPTLVEQARRGDLKAFESIVRLRMDAVYRLTLAIVGNEADASDATQDAFVAAWRQIGSLRDADRLDAWLARIAVNSGRMVARGRRRRSVREIGGLTADTTDLPSRIGDPAGQVAEDARALGAALEHLSPDQRAILALHHLDGRSVGEIASILQVPEGTVKSRLFAARRALVARLDGADE
jgi:RNA polymerase sigma-70 factor (ECF subfamily)